jgi:hypothetical protein
MPLLFVAFQVDHGPVHNGQITPLRFAHTTSLAISQRTHSLAISQRLGTQACLPRDGDLDSSSSVDAVAGVGWGIPSIAVVAMIAVASIAGTSIEKSTVDPEFSPKRLET